MWKCVSTEDLIGSINRTICGENHYKSKLTEKDVIEIRELFKKNYSQSELARMFCVNQKPYGNYLKV